MKNLYGLILLWICTVLFACTRTEINNVPSSSESQEQVELNMQAVVNGDSVLQAYTPGKEGDAAMNKSAQATTASYGSETLVYTSSSQTLTTSSVKAFETTSLVTGLLTGKTYRIAIQITSGNASATMYQSLSNLPTGITTEKIESNDGDLTIISNVRSLWLSYARLKNNFQKAYVMLNKIGTANVNFVVKVYVSNDTYQSQNWVSVKDYIHYNQRNYPDFYVNSNLTAKGGSICAQNAYYAALHMMLPARFPATSNTAVKNGLNSIHTRLGIVSYFVTPGSGNISYLKSLADNDPIISPYVGGYLNNSPCQSLTSIQNRGDLGRCTGGSYLDAHATRANMKAGIQSSLAAGKYVIVAINTVNVINTSNSIYSYLDIANSNSGGHVIVVVGFDMTASGVGSRVYYKDGFGLNAETRMCDLTLFLDSNLANGSNNAYQYLALKSCGCN